MKSQIVFSLTDYGWEVSWECIDSSKFSKIRRKLVSRHFCALSTIFAPQTLRKKTGIFWKFGGKCDHTQCVVRSETVLPRGKSLGWENTPKIVTK
jgi:hypothetical protein